MNEIKNSIKPSIYTLNCRGKLLVLDEPKVMGIINATPDSFYAASRSNTIDEVMKQAEKMLNEGADILDIGGQSTRPGSERIPVDEELSRVMPAIEKIHSTFPGAILSVDTYQSVVAKQAVEAGASIINDISGGSMDDQMISTVASLRVPYICMHMKGTPADMQKDPSYENVTKEVLNYFIKKLADLKQAGIHDIIVDPGFGFGKTIAHNFELLRHLDLFNILERPILAGLSRKSTIWKTLGISPEGSLNGTTVLNTIALTKGASILRVHDVKEAKEACKLFVETSNKKSAPY